MLASGEGLGQDGRGGGKILLWDVRQAKSKLQSLDYNNVKGRPGIQAGWPTLLIRGGFLALHSPVVVAIWSRLGRTTGWVEISELSSFFQTKSPTVGRDDGSEPEDEVPRGGHRPLLLATLDLAHSVHDRWVE